MNTTRTGIRRRTRDAALLLALAALLTAAWGTFSQPWTAKHTATTAAQPPLTVEYRTNTSALAAAAQPSLQVINTSRQSVDLRRVTLRYYLSDRGGAAYGFNCVQAGIGCSKITGLIGSTTDRYLQIGFAADAGTLAPGQNSGELSMEIYRLDHQSLDQSTDRSFTADDADYTPEKTITAYLDGTLVWGTEPGGPAHAGSGSGVQALAGPGKPSTPGTSSSPASAAPSANTTPTPAGIVFDAFHYTGPDDPALNRHGWGVRSGTGGPGIHDTWSASGVSFPAADGATPGQALQLRAATDGTQAGTTQAELESTGMRFLTGTFAARVHFNGHPTTGATGDPINEAFYLISPQTKDGYSELDNEYMPIGWGEIQGPVLDTTSWADAQTKDRVTRRNTIDLTGWHTIVVTAAAGHVTYAIDGTVLFTSSGQYVPRAPMSANFNAWFGDLFATGRRAWDMQVNWFFASTAAVAPADVDKTVAGLYARGSAYVNTMGTS